jgi:hydroxyacylglutathione hydrolase
MPVSDGSRVECGPFSFQTIETPGHSSDSVCYRTDRLLFTGDTLSACAVGTAPTPFERALLLSSIRTKLLPLEQELLLFPGHGPPSTLAVERAFNPYLKEQI